MGAMAEVLVADRSERGKLRFTGEQRLWFCDQVLTQRFADMLPGEARVATMITVHGRTTALMEFVATDDALLCHFEPELSAELPGALERYVFATRVEIEDVSERYGLVLLAGDGWEELAGAVAAIVQPSPLVGVSAGYLWVERDDTERVVKELEVKGARSAGEDELEALRIAAGLPRWGYELSPKTLPQETGIDAFAVHYDKGCYLGQEAMAKIHFRGKVNRRLARLRASGPLGRGADVLLDGERVGVVTSAAGELGLALLRYTVQPGARVEAGGVPAEVVA